MTVVPPHSCKRIPGLPREKCNFTMPLDVAYKYPEDTTVMKKYILIAIYS